MTLDEKREFIVNFMSEMTHTLIQESAKFPDEWDGHEIRLYIERGFISEAKFSHRSRRRVAEVNRVCAVTNLKY